MNHAIVSLTCSILLLSACGRDGSMDAPSKHFTSRTQDLYSESAEPGDVELEITNAIPKVVVPEPHLPTVAHLNAQICSRSTGPSRTHQSDDGNTIYEPHRGTSKCLDLSPTIYVDTTVRYTIKKHTVASLLNEDYDALEVSFASSTQTTSHHYSCGSTVTKINYVPDEINRAEITVNGQHSVSFNCK